MEQQNFSREDYLFLAKLAEQSERYSEMIEFVGKFAKTEGELTSEERHIVSVAYKNVVGSKRAEFRVLSAIEQKESRKGNDQNIQYIKNYKQTIENELKKLCREILALIDSFLLPNSKSDESKIFFLKMKGDYCRYLTEFLMDQEGSEAVEKALKAYTDAAELVDVINLTPTHPLRLGLYLNFSVFQFEILQNAKVAKEMAEKAFNMAIANIQNVNEETYKDCTLIMQLLRDNLTLWTSEMPNDDGQDDY